MASARPALVLTAVALEGGQGLLWARVESLGQETSSEGHQGVVDFEAHMRASRGKAVTSGLSETVLVRGFFNLFILI